MHRLKFLKVKIKSLAAEARIIAHEKRKALERKDYVLANELHEHRMNVVRREARAAHLAYGLSRGLTRDQIEPTRRQPAGFELPERNLQKRVVELTRKYGDFSKLPPEWVALTAPTTPRRRESIAA